MNNQPATINPLWFFAKIGILCALGVVVFLQVRAMFRHKGSAVPHVAQVRKAPTMDKQAWLKKREEETKQERAKLPQKPPLPEALQNPKIYAMIKDEFKCRLDAPYGKLYRELNLPPATLQKLRDLLAEKELNMVESYKVAESAKIPLGAKGLAALRDDADGSIRQLLGDAAYADYKFYETTLPARNHVNGLEESLSYRSEPLTSDQYNALVESLSLSTDPKLNPANGAWMGNFSPDITRESLEIAHDILTPSQFAVYRKAYDMQLLSQQMEKQYSQDLQQVEKYAQDTYVIGPSPQKKKVGNNKKKK